MNEYTDYIPAALYARVSSDRQDVDLSVAAQLRALRDYAEKNGYHVAREYVDEAESGRIADRPQFQKMLDDPVHAAVAAAGEAVAQGAAAQLSQLHQERDRVTVTIARRELRRWLRESPEGQAVEDVVSALLYM